ncbi:MAG: Fic family protein [Eubacteriales bacterium]|nr:Fic family protein [Eubacteriales bacterium]
MSKQNNTSTMQEMLLREIPYPIYDASFIRRLVRANQILAVLNERIEHVGFRTRFLYECLTKEGIYASALAGREIAFRQLLLADAAGTEREELPMIPAYMAALNIGTACLSQDGFSELLFDKLHEALMLYDDEMKSHGGKHRKRDSCALEKDILPASVVPLMKSAQISDAMRELARYMNETKDEPLIAAARIHYQFLRIRPYAVGNLQIAIILSVLLLMHRGELKHPMICLARMIFERREDYLSALQKMTSSEDPMTWYAFFMDGIHDAADASARTATKRMALYKEDAERVRKAEQGVRRQQKILRIFDYIMTHPIFGRAPMADTLCMPYPEVTRFVQTLCEMNVVEALEDSGRCHEYRYGALIDIWRDNMQ